MARVTLWGSLKPFTDGAESLERDARTIGALLDGLVRDFPGLAPHFEEGVSVAVDGVIYRDSLLAKIAPDSEVFILPRLAGG